VAGKAKWKSWTTGASLTSWTREATLPDIWITKSSTGNLPRLWRGGDVAIEKLVLQSSAFQSGESYRLRLGVFDLASGERLPISICDFPLTDNQTAAIADEKTNLRLILIRFEKPYGKNPDH
jgi:hypothetical protein